MRLAGKLPVKKVVAEIGPQEDGSSVLEPSLHFAMAHITMMFKINSSCGMSDSNSNITIFTLRMTTPNRIFIERVHLCLAGYNYASYYTAPNCIW